MTIEMALRNLRRINRAFGILCSGPMALKARLVADPGLFVAD